MSLPLINISHKQALFYAGFLVLYEFLTYTANDMIMPGMLHVVSSFHGEQSDVARSMTLYILGGASLQLFLGPLSDRYGRRPVMLTGAVLFSLFTFFIGCSQSMNQFLIARFFEGMGLCFIGVIGYATLQEIYSEMDAIRLVSILSNISLAAPLLGPLAGAVFLYCFSWRAMFLTIGLLALLALWGLWYYMPEPVGAVKKDGEVIPRVSLAPKVIYNNYRYLLINPTFIFGSFATGLSAVPCITWVALSPVIIMTWAQLSILTYALWQLPLFGAIILGNIYLNWLTHRLTVRRIIFRGSALLMAGLLLTSVLPFWMDARFEWLIPGLTLYGFGLGVVTAPLNRYILFSTHIAKGTAYAKISMINMAVMALGIEAGNFAYTDHNNTIFALFCGLSGLAYLISLCVAMLIPYASRKMDKKGDIKKRNKKSVAGAE